MGVSSVQPLHHRNESIVEFRGARKRYGDHEVLKGIDLEILRGDSIVIIGPSGCGKSTMLRCINGLEQLSGGMVIVNGEDLGGKNLDLARLRQRVGIVFQQFSLFPHLNIISNLTLAPRRIRKVSKKEAEDRAFSLLDRVGLADKAHNFPKELSGGQQQRVAIARALMMEPEVMLFDEVTSALDPELVGEVLQVMEDLAEQGMTMFVVTHEMSFARDVGSHLVFMDGGVIVEQGDPKTTLDAPRTERLQRFLRRINR